MAVEKILVIDDEELVRDFVAETLRRENLDVVTAENGKKGLAAFKEKEFDMVFTDMKMPDITGIEVLRKVKEKSPSTYVVVITAFGSVENAVEAMRLGAFNYLIKPFSPETIETVIDKARENLFLKEENLYLRQQLGQSGTNFNRKVIGESPVMKKIFADIERISKSNASVFIYGESGTGKEVIANAIYHASLRADKPFIKVNCAAVPDTCSSSPLICLSTPARCSH